VDGCRAPALPGRRGQVRSWMPEAQNSNVTCSACTANCGKASGCTHVAPLGVRQLSLDWVAAGLGAAGRRLWTTWAQEAWLRCGRHAWMSAGPHELPFSNSMFQVNMQSLHLIAVLFTGEESRAEVLPQA
jgi:hypothetical protein